MDLPELDIRLLEETLDKAGSLDTKGVNPRVAAIVADSTGAIISTGLHQGAGHPHAEVVALNELDRVYAGSDRSKLTLYVSLEPCRHQGRQPPCVEAILSARIARVVYGAPDPTVVARGGSGDLRERGVEVIGPNFTLRSFEVDFGWFASVRVGRPYITLKLATTMDGFIADSDDRSKWITSRTMHEYSASLRTKFDAIVTGTGTVIADAPSLTARKLGVTLSREHQPLRVVVGDRSLQAASTLCDDNAPTMALPRGTPGKIVGTLYDRDCRRILIEAGPTLSGAFIESDLVDEVHQYVSPRVLGRGKHSFDMERLLGRSDFGFRIKSVSEIDDGAMLVWRRNLHGVD